MELKIPSIAERKAARKSRAASPKGPSEPPRPQAAAPKQRVRVLSGGSPVIDAENLIALARSMGADASSAAWLGLPSALRAAFLRKCSAQGVAPGVALEQALRDWLDGGVGPSA